MKKIVFLLFFALFLNITNCQKINKTNSADIHYTRFTELEKEFKNPTAVFCTTPLWVWHYKVTKSEIDYSLQELHSQGIGGVFIHPRSGLVTEYISDEWFELYNHAIEKAKSLNMKIWIYDENTYPSGFAGGHVPAEIPESYNQGQGLKMEESPSLPANAFDNYELILKKTADQYIVINSSDQEINSKGEYYLFKKLYYSKSKWYGGYSYVDLLYPGVTEKFIDLTMSGYEKTIGSEFGKTVPGIFTDEPNISTPQSRNCIRWTPDLFVQFQKRWGYDLKQNLPSLYKEVGDWQKVRHNYYALLLDLFIERWSKPWFEYTEQNNLNWTGHYWEHGWPSPRHGSDNMAMYAWHQQPSIDMLFNNFSKQGTQFGNARAVKELSSAANQMGRYRTLSETYGGAGWELRFEDMKRLGDWEYVLGVNFMNQHLTFMSLAGNRKHDYPQSFSYHEPWWKLYKPLADYYARLSAVLSAGKQQNDILVLEPTTAAWMYYSSTENNEKFYIIKDSFTKFVNDLEQYQAEYDLGSENIISLFGSIRNGKFVIGERAYSTIVLPPYTDNLDSATLSLLKKYLKQGGTVISFTTLPTFIDGEKSDTITKLSKDYQSNWTHYDQLDDKNIDRLLPKGFSIQKGKHENGLLFHMRRQLDDGQIIFLANSSLEEPATGTILIDGKRAQTMDALTGEIAPCYSRNNSNKLEIPFELPPAGSLLLYIDEQNNSQAIPKPEKINYTKIQTFPSVIKRLEPNVLTLDYCTLNIKDQTFQNIYYTNADKLIWQAHGFNDNPWDKSIQYKQTILEKDNFGPDSGFKASYTFQIENGVDTKSLKAVIERPDLWQVIINGNKIEPQADKWFIDKSLRIFDISSHVKTGTNHITLNCTQMNIHAELEPVYIIGNFNLLSKSQGWNIVPAQKIKTGNWKIQGLPFYGHGIEYTKTVNFESDKKYKIRLDEWQGTAAEIRINDQYAGFIGWQPYELDISSFIKNGENKVSVVVYGSLKNTLGPHHNVNHNGITGPGDFKRAPEKQPQGSEYDLLDYGLFKDFEIVMN